MTLDPAHCEAPGILPLELTQLASNARPRHRIACFHGLNYVSKWGDPMSHPAFQIELGNEVAFGEIVSIIGCYNDGRDVAYRNMARAGDVRKQFVPPGATVVVWDAMPFMSRHRKTKSVFASDGLRFDAGLKNESSP